jgi:hypothetical protein
MFHSYVHDCLRPYIDHFAVCCLEDILIYSSNEKEHEEYVHKVLQRLGEFGLYCTGEKYSFGVSDVGFLGFVITPNEVGMELDRISTIEYLPTPKSVGDVHVLLGFMNFYRRFIWQYANVTLSPPQ